jgi:hypothetical protein
MIKKIIMMRKLLVYVVMLTMLSMTSLPALQAAEADAASGNTAAIPVVTDLSAGAAPLALSFQCPRNQGAHR